MSDLSTGGGCLNKMQAGTTTCGLELVFLNINQFDTELDPREPIPENSSLDALGKGFLRIFSQ